MKVLGIETATSVCGTAIIENGINYSERSFKAPYIHSEKLVSLVESVLADSKLTTQDLDGIAVSIGPGSFTGLRIGLSVGKGLAYAINKPLICVCTLESLAWNIIQEGIAQEDDYIIPMIDARRTEVYMALYRYRGDGFEEIVMPCAIVLQKLGDLIPDKGSVIITGDGADKFQAFLQKDPPVYFPRITIPIIEKRLCRSFTVGLLGERKFLQGERSDIASVEPMYVKEFYTLMKTQHLQV